MAVVSILGFAVLGGAPLTAFAQAGQDQTVSLEMDQADVREALRALFKSTGLSYSVSQEVQGTVSLNLHSVAFSTALENILRQVKATYRLEAGVYQILPREDQVAIQPDLPEPVGTGKNTSRRRVFTRSGDPMLIATLIANGGADFKLSPELSTVIKMGSFGGNGGFGNTSFGGSNGGNGFGSNWGNGSGSNRGNNGFNGGFQDGGRGGQNNLGRGG